MRKLLRSYTSFTRAERIGLMCLCTVLVLLITIKATMHLWVHSVVNTADQARLSASWAAYKRSQPARNADDTPVKHKDFQDASDEQLTPLPDTININTADSATLVRLKGIGPVTAGRITEWRRAHGPFTRISQLSDCGRFTQANISLLSKHLTFATPKK